MPQSRRVNGAGNIYIKHGAYYGRWYTDEGGQANRKIGKVRRPGTRDGLTRGQAEKRLRELMATIQVTTDPARTVAVAGEALLAQLGREGARGRTSRRRSRISGSILCRSSARRRSTVCAMGTSRG
jgi:hypothetical protein